MRGTLATQHALTIEHAHQVAQNEHCSAVQAAEDDATQDQDQITPARTQSRRSPCYPDYHRGQRLSMPSQSTSPTTSPSEVIMTACRHMKVAAWPTKDEITQAVKDLWTGDPRQYTEISIEMATVWPIGHFTETAGVSRGR